MICNICPAGVSDLPALTELYLAYSEELQKYGLSYEINALEVPAVLGARVKSRLFYVGTAHCGGEACGFIICSIAKIGREYLCEGGGQVGYVNDIYIIPSKRYTGCANALLDAAKAWLREAGICSMELTVLSGNIDGKAFWKRFGAQEIAAFYHIKF